MAKDLGPQDIEVRKVATNELTSVMERRLSSLPLTKLEYGNSYIGISVTPTVRVFPLFLSEEQRGDMLLIEKALEEWREDASVELSSTTLADGRKVQTIGIDLLPEEERELDYYYGFLYVYRDGEEPTITGTHYHQTDDAEEYEAITVMDKKASIDDLTRLGSMVRTLGLIAPYEEIAAHME